MAVRASSRALLGLFAATSGVLGVDNSLAAGLSMEALSLGTSWAEKAQRSESTMEAAVEEMQQQFLQTIFPFPDLLDELRMAQMTTSERMPALRLDSKRAKKLSLLGGQSSPSEVVDWWKNLPTNLTFIHIARTGGTAVESVRYNYERKLQGVQKPQVGVDQVHFPMWGANDDRQHGNGELQGEKVHNSFRVWQPEKAFNAHCYKQHHPANMNPVAFENSDTFCLVRDPVSKAISQFGFANAFYKNMAPDCTPATLNKFLNKSFAMLPENPYVQDCHWVPQAAYVYQWNNATLKVDYSKGRFCKNVLRTTHLTRDFNDLMEKYGYPFRFDEKKRSGFSSAQGCSSLKANSVDAKHISFIEKYFKDDYRLIQEIDHEYEVRDRVASGALLALKRNILRNIKLDRGA